MLTVFYCCSHRDVNNVCIYEGVSFSRLDLWAEMALQQKKKKKMLLDCVYSLYPIFPLIPRGYLSYGAFSNVKHSIVSPPLYTICAYSLYFYFLHAFGRKK